MQDILIKEKNRFSREDRVALFLSAALLPVVFGLYLKLGYLEGLLSWTIWFVLLGLGTLLVRRLLGIPLSLLRFGFFSYLVLSVVGLILIVAYRALYNFDFAPWGDDSYYFRQITRIVAGDEKVVATFYEYIMSAWYLAVQFTKPNPTLLDMLPMNWAIGAMVMVLSYALSYEVTKFRCSLFLVSITLLANCTLTDTVVNLYRDGMIALFFLIVMLAIARSKILIAIVGTVLAGGIRGANGMLMALFVLYAWASKSQAVARNWVLSSVVLIMLGGIGFFLDYELGLGSRLRTLTGNTQNTGRSVSESVAGRLQRIVARGDNAKDVTIALIGTVPGGFVLMPVATMFAPTRFLTFRRNIDCTIFVPGKGREEFRASGIVPTALFSWITILSWVVVVPYLILGIAAAFRGTSEERKFLTFFVLALLSITYVSLQGRHRLIFIVLFPVFAASGSKVAPMHPGTIIALRVITVMILIIANITTFIM